MTALSNQFFPLYPGIKNNVRFWEKIYATYSLNDAVIHDSDNLSIIYEVVSLLDPELPGADRVNKLAKRHTRDKYATLLKKIAKTKTISSAEEKRVAALFQPPYRFKKMAKAARNVRSQTGQKERFIEGVTRSKAYIQEMKKIFRSYRLPEDLAYLPHVESSFNTRAYSKFGAAGMWQFTRGTGQQYLTINYTIDERLDPITATYAAAQYLDTSYKALKNWPLAITSYNYGTAGMIRAVAENGSYENIFANYNKGHFKFASKNFYSEFLAALKVAKKLENSSIYKHNKPAFRYLKLPGFIHIKHIKDSSQLTPAQIKKLNPALRPPVFTGEKLLPKGYSLRLPDDKKLTSRIASIPSSRYSNNQKRSKFHRVKKGDSAGKIARTYHVSLKQLKKANNLDRRATIYIRQKLRIPPPSVTLSTRKKYHGPKQAWSVPLLMGQKKNRPPATPGANIPAKDTTLYNVFSIFTKNRQNYGYITVQPEESLGLYAQWLGSTSKSLTSLNKYTTLPALEPGQQLLLNFDTLTTEQFEEKRLDFLRETEEDFFRVYSVIGKKSYKVNSGDTFWDLCYNKFDIPMWLLKRYNSALNLSEIKSSQVLTVPILKAL